MRSHRHPPLVKQRQQKSQRRKWKAEIVSVSVLSKVLNLDKLSCPQIWNIEQGTEHEEINTAGRQTTNYKYFSRASLLALAKSIYYLLH